MKPPEGTAPHNESMNQDDSASLRGSLDQVKLIATGGMSQIFRARQPSLDRFIAVKRLKEELLGNPEAKERFRREAKALASVLHQNVAHVYDFVETTRESYILMEYIDGLDLSNVIAKVGHLPPEIAASILLGVAKGVRYIHDHNLIHRDIKPSNIRLTSWGEVKLMDFGIVMDAENHSLTRPGMMVGSPNYLSPEQVLGDPISPQSDIFLLGICLYEMLTGSRPFKEEGRETVFQKIRDTKYIPVRSMQSQVPLDLEKMVKLCLQKDLGKRYANVADLIFDIESFLGAEASAHADDIILRFLDREALITPSVPLAKAKDKKVKIRSKPLSWVILAFLVGLFLASVWGAYELGEDVGVKKSLELRSKYGAPKPLKNQ